MKTIRLVGRVLFVAICWPVQLMDHGTNGFWKAVVDFVRHGK